MLVMVSLTPVTSWCQAAHELGGIGAFVELAVGGGLDDHVGFGQQVVHHLDHVVEVGLDDVEVAVVVVGDDRRDVALRDAIDVIRGDVERPDHRVERVVDALDDLLRKSPWCLAGIGAGGQFAVDGGAAERLASATGR